MSLEQWIMIKSLIFAFRYKHLISTKAFFYLLNGGKLPRLNYPAKLKPATETYYIQSYLDEDHEFKLRILNSYFKEPLNGLVLATVKVRKGLITDFTTFYFESLEGLAYYG